MPTGNLPAEGKAVWEKVYESAKTSSTCKDEGDRKDECAARVAWKAVANAGWRKIGDTWHKSAELEEFSLTIKKAVFDEPTQEMRWRADTSDIDDDSYGDNMTLELFEDFVSHIKANELAPEPFRSDFWQGGMPYLSVSHYPDMNGKAVPGSVDNVYLDGKFLKATGKFSKTPLGRACFDAACKSVYSKDDEDKVRISIAFLDWMHKHKSNGFTFERKDLGDFCPECLKELINGEYKGRAFLKGQLVHLAQTKVPVNKRTEITVEVDRAMAKTRKEDAASIVGDELAEQLEEEAKLVGKSEALVIKADEVVEEAQHEDMPSNKRAEDEKYPDCKDEKTGEMDQDCVKMHQQQKADIVEEPEELVEKAKKKEADCEHPSSHYLVVEDASKPSTWHLRVKNCSGEDDTRLMGAAKAALTVGYRGNKYEGPNKSAALSKLKGMYKRHGIDFESKSDVIEDSEIDKSYLGEVGISEPVYYKPFGGATSLKDAKAVLEAQKEKMRISDLWYALQSVIENIANDETVENKADAMSTAVEEFKDMMADKSATIYNALVTLSTTKEKLLPHPLDSAIAKLKSEYDNTVLMEISADEKLQSLQPALNEFAQTMVGIVKSTVTENKSTAQPDIAELIAKALMPLAQKVELLSQQLSQQPIQQSNVVVPQSRAINPALVQQAVTSSVKKSETPHLRALIERTT